MLIVGAALVIYGVVAAVCYGYAKYLVHIESTYGEDPPAEGDSD